MNDTLNKILEIDARHNELLDRLAELDATILTVLENWTRSKSSEPNQESSE